MPSFYLVAKEKHKIVRITETASTIKSSIMQLLNINTCRYLKNPNSRKNFSQWLLEIKNHNLSLRTEGVSPTEIKYILSTTTTRKNENQNIVVVW